MDSGKTGTLIAEARKAKGLIQRQLAETLHISDRTVSKWERGAGFPDVALLEPLADALGLTVRSLLRGEAEPPEAESSGTVSALPEDILLREVIRTLYQQQRGKLRRNIGRVFGGLAALALVGFVLFGILDRSGAFQREIARTVTAGIYQDAERVGETTVTIEGSLYWLGSGASGGPLPWRRRRRPAGRGPMAASPGAGRRRKATRRSTGDGLVSPEWRQRYSRTAMFPRTFSASP